MKKVHEWDMRFWYVEGHSQRVTTGTWKLALLDHRDTIIKKGTLRKLLAKNLGYGVVEVTLKPLEV